MFISDDLKDNIVFVGFNRNGEHLWVGTGFLVATPAAVPGQGYQYLVTAKHVIVQIDAHSKDKKALLRINHTDRTAHVYETNVSDWTFHPQTPSVDVAVAPIALGELIELRAFPLALIREQQAPLWVSVGTDVCAPGLFYNHAGAQRNLPVLRIGSISALPEEPIFLNSLGAAVDAYLIEARSIGGLSGSPVFAYRETGTGRFRSDWEVYLIGLIHGHFDVSVLPPDSNELSRRAERVNMGLAIVIPTRKILEVVDQPKFRDHRLAEGASA